MRLNRLAAPLMAALLTLTACGGDDSEEPEKDAGASEPSGVPSVEIEDSGRKLPPRKVCQALDAAEVGEILGDKVKRGPVVQGSCTFADLKPNSQRSVGITYLKLAAVGGVEGLETAMAAAAGGEAEEVPDLGEAAFVSVVEGAGGAQAVAAIATGDALVQMQLLPGPGASQEQARGVAINLLRLVDARV